MLKRNCVIFSAGALVIMCLFLNGCIFDRLNAKQDNNSIPFVMEPGFQMFTTPRNFDGPGTVFRINNEKNKIPVADLNRDNKLRVFIGQESMGTIARTGNTTFDLGFIFWPIGKADLDTSKNFNLTFKVGGVTRQITYDSDIKPLIDQELAKIDWDFRSRYYVIRETISVESIYYHFDNDAILDIGGEVKVKQLAKANANMTWHTKDYYQLSETYGAPQRIFYKVERITKPVSQHKVKLYDYGVKAQLPDIEKTESATSVSFSLSPAEEKIVWVKEETPKTSF